MKKILLIIITAIFAVACEKKIEGESITPENFIGFYEDGDLVLKSMPDAEETQFLQIDLDNVVRYSNTPQDPDKTNIFKQIAERNRDVNFNRPISLTKYYSTKVLADNYRSIHAVSDAAWDDKHPAGESLDDILLLSASSFSEYVRSGYETMFPSMFGHSEWCTFRISLDQLTTSDIEMLSRIAYTGPPKVLFSSTPSIDKEHTITLTMTTTDGKVQTASIKCKPVQTTNYW